MASPSKKLSEHEKATLGRPWPDTKAYPYIVVMRIDKRGQRHFLDVPTYAAALELEAELVRDRTTREVMVLGAVALRRWECT